MIGLLTETIGNPTPIEIPFVPERQLPSGDLPFPIEPQRWHFRQSVEYSTTANRAVLDYASRYRETLLFNIYQMGRNAIERGRRDHWTVQPSSIAAVRARAGRAVQGDAQSSRWRRRVASELFDELRRPEDRDPRGFILPADQPDFGTAVKFANTLIKTGIEVHEATETFEAAGTRYPAGTLVVRADQAFRAHVMDMFEPQDHPNDFAYTGGPPIPPYDNAGWTLAYQMGIAFDRVLDGFDGPFRKVDGFVPPPAGGIAGTGRAEGYLMHHRVNDAVILTNRVLAGGGDVAWLGAPVTVGDQVFQRGDIYVSAAGVSRAELDAWARELGVEVVTVAEEPRVDAVAIRPARVALWDRYGGSMPSGWTRWLLEQFEFPFEVVYPATLNEGDLSAYDVVLLPDGALGGWRSSPAAASIPEEFRDRLGRLSVGETAPRLREFAEAGGTVIAIGSATAIAERAGVPLANHLVDESGEALASDRYYVPGSVLRVTVDTTRPVAFGLPSQLDVLFDNSPVFRMTADADDVYPVAQFTSDRPLRSGWAWGEAFLEGGIPMVEARVGDGAMYLFGPEILYRGQPHGTFKLLFNGLHLARAEAVRLGAGR
jgi:hypothetical protein